MEHRRAQYAAAPPPPSSVDSRPPPPAPYSHHHQQQYHQQQSHLAQLPPPHPASHTAPPPPPPTSVAPHQSSHAHYPHPPPPNPSPAASAHSTGPALPPIQSTQAYVQAGPPPDQHSSLPSFRPPPPPQNYDPREGPGQEYYQYGQHNRSGHATPAPVNRSYSHDSGQQRTPTTPANHGPYPTAPSAATDGPPPPHQQSQPPSASHHMDHAHHVYPPPNGTPHALPPPAAPQGHGPPPQPHPEQQHPHYMTPVMDGHPQYPPQPMAQPMFQHPYGPASAPMYQVGRKKQMRATQACEQCRQRKQKCDEGAPCSFCKDNALQCLYRDTPPVKTDKNMDVLMNFVKTVQDSLETNQASLDALNKSFTTLEEQVRRLEQSRIELGPAAPAKAIYPKPFNRVKDHRTAPHKLLLLWPSVSALLEAAKYHGRDTYVMEAEDRGILRLYTRGQGSDENDGTHAGSQGSPAANSDDGVGGGLDGIASPEGQWGTGLPQPSLHDIRRSNFSGWGGLKPDSSLDLDAKTISSLHESYLRHFHVMHPFLDKARLRKLMDNFSRRYSPGARNKFQFDLAQSGGDGERPLKRQRSNGPSISNSFPTGGTDGGWSPNQVTDRSPSTAIVYLVLALGKICQHKEPLPSFVRESKLNANQLVAHQTYNYSSSSPMSGTIRPPAMSPASQRTTHPTPPTENGHMHQPRSRRSSMDGAPVAGPRNLDVVPGLAYYAKAAEILGEQADGNDLVHVQMFLLAGLYKGQLARVKESMSWLTMAGRASLSLNDRYNFYHDDDSADGDLTKRIMTGREKIKSKRDDLIVLSAWTCLQLESDILAELRLPSSGIQDVENCLIYPSYVPDEESSGTLQPDGIPGDSPFLYEFWTYQLFLRRRLNKVHREMYGPGCLDQSLEVVRATLEEHQNVLADWRKILPKALRWDDSEPPASDILAARLRAKYWGARYVINRPFLDYALHIMPHVKGGMRVRDAACDVKGNPRDPADVHIFEAIQGMGDSFIRAAAHRCIEAAMQSTIAFDKVPGRLIVTNIHGTAHAQFGNMLVLAAAYHSRVMKPSVPAQRFESLLQRTIGFLRKLVNISPTCQLDCQILEEIQGLLFGVPEDMKGAYVGAGVEWESAASSFSTTATT